MAATKGNMTLRMEPELKAQAAALFKSLGMDLSTATGIFYRQALRCHGLPFEVKLDEPNEVTYAAMEAAEKVVTLRSWKKSFLFCAGRNHYHRHTEITLLQIRETIKA